MEQDCISTATAGNGGYELAELKNVRGLCVPRSSPTSPVLTLGRPDLGPRVWPLPGQTCPCEDHWGREVHICPVAAWVVLPLQCPDRPTCE